MRRSDPPPVRIQVKVSQALHLLRLEHLVRASARRELVPVFEVLASMLEAGVEGGTIQVPCFSTAPLLAAFEAYALLVPGDKVLSSLAWHLEAAESEARRVAADWREEGTCQGVML